MSKDKLNDLKKWKMNLNETLVLNGHEISEELKEETRKYRDLLGYAIEQAERVQNLEEKLNVQIESNQKLDKINRNWLRKNQRYRETLKEIKNEVEWMVKLSNKGMKFESILNRCVEVLEKNL